MFRTYFTGMHEFHTPIHATKSPLCLRVPICPVRLSQRFLVFLGDNPTVIEYPAKLLGSNPEFMKSPTFMLI
jgi:hypothetical protein